MSSRAGYKQEVLCVYTIYMDQWSTSKSCKKLNHFLHSVASNCYVGGSDYLYYRIVTYRIAEKNGKDFHLVNHKNVH